MHCFNLTVIYAVLPKSGAHYPECVHYRLNWAEKGVIRHKSLISSQCKRIRRAFTTPAFTTLMHYAENECAMPIRLHCNELRALCLTTNALCRTSTAESGALLLKSVLIVYFWPKKRCIWAPQSQRYRACPECPMLGTPRTGR